MMRWIAFVALAAAVAPAQQTKAEKKLAKTERTVQGTVSDADGKAIDGAVVQLKDERTLQVRSFITEKEGAYHFAGLKIDNDYQLEARYNGMTSGWKTLSVFDTRKQPVVNLKLDKQEKPEKKP
ncbi:MAG TPA: carboxypeptidase-like regulatory domain-containing protein [Bryobacteraceae bacterium]|nr:carboxypeptidase-like regulatory domain-containing protein [Bryobacteraceae bacterium]